MSAAGICQPGDDKNPQLAAPVLLSEYVDHGLYLVELRPADKHPVHPGWNTHELCERTTQSDAFAKRVAEGQAGVGLALAYSGLVAVDIDDIEQARLWFADRGIDLDVLINAPDAVRRESSRPNRTLLLYRVSDPLRTRKVSAAGIEFLCATSQGLTTQIAIPPSVNPKSRRRYEWKGDWRQPPELPDDLRTVWESIGATEVDPHRKATPPDEKSGIVGAICRAYDPREEFPHSALPASLYQAMCENFGPGAGDRYAYLKATSGRTDGVKVLEDGAIQIFDATFPGGAGSMNIFDVMRIALYGPDSAEDLTRPMQERSGYRSLVQALRDEPRVLADLEKQAAQGQAEFLADFKDLDTAEAAEAAESATERPRTERRARFTPVPVGEFSNGPEPEWIIDGVLPRAELAVIYGESGCGKSFFTLDMVLAVARFVPWQARKTVQGKVVYICGESPGGFRKRLLAYACKNDLKLPDLNAAMFLVGNAPDLLKAEDVTELCNELRALGPLAVIVVDTLARATPGANENSGEDMGKALKHCQVIHRTTGALVVLIHHSGKDQSRGARGWSGIRAATDTEIEVTKMGNVRRAQISKQRDGEDGLLFGFELVEVSLGLDSERELSSLVVQPQTAELSAKGRRRGPRGVVQKAVDAATRELLPLGVGSVAVNALIDAVVLKLNLDPQRRDNRRRDALRAINQLIENELLHIAGNNRVSLYPGPAEEVPPKRGEGASSQADSTTAAAEGVNGGLKSTAGRRNARKRGTQAAELDAQPVTGTEPAGRSRRTGDKSAPVTADEAQAAPNDSGPNSGNTEVADLAAGPDSAPRDAPDPDCRDTTWLRDSSSVESTPANPARYEVSVECDPSMAESARALFTRCGHAPSTTQNPDGTVTVATAVNTAEEESALITRLQTELGARFLEGDA